MRGDVLGNRHGINVCTDVEFLVHETRKIHVRVFGTIFLICFVYFWGTTQSKSNIFFIFWEMVFLGAVGGSRHHKIRVVVTTAAHMTFCTLCTTID